MRRALVLGAGASAAYSGSPTGLRMPLARNFFEVSYRLPQMRNPWVLLHGLFNYISERKRAEPVSYLQSGIDVEELDSEIYEAAITSLTSRMTQEFMWNFKAHHELVFLFAFVLNTIQNGPISKIHRRLAEAIAEDDGIVTFNWDTLMDRALAEKGRWRVDTGYGVRPQRIFRDGWQEPGAMAATAPVLWKLHGSSNWITSHEQVERGKLILSQASPAEALNVFECVFQSS